MLAGLVHTGYLPPMAKDEPHDESQPTSETGRISSDLMEKMREMCFHSRDGRGKRTKITQMIDNLLRPAVEAAYAEFKAQQATSDASKKRKGN